MSACDPGQRQPRPMSRVRGISRPPAQQRIIGFRLDRLEGLVDGNGVAPLGTWVLLLLGQFDCLGGFLGRVIIGVGLVFARFLLGAL